MLYEIGFYQKMNHSADGWEWGKVGEEWDFRKAEVRGIPTVFRIHIK